MADRIKSVVDGLMDKVSQFEQNVAPEINEQPAKDDLSVVNDLKKRAQELLREDKENVENKDTEPQPTGETPEEEAPEEVEKDKEEEADVPIDIIGKEASVKLFTAINKTMEKHAGFKSIAIPAATGALGLAGGYVGGRLHERSKDEVEDRAIAQHFLRTGYNAAARAIYNRLHGGGNVKTE
jgi:hypothetical protein